MKSFKITEPPTVLIVDQDLGFVWWLGDILHGIGCTVVPALSCQQAIILMKELNLNVDLLFVDPSLGGVSSMIEALSMGQNRIKIVDVRSMSEDMPDMPTG
jgi:hypothetical protein